MKYPLDYRTNLASAEKLFLPIVRILKFREFREKKFIYIKDFPDFNFMNINNFVLTVKTTEMDSTLGLFFCRIKGDLVDCYIILNSKLYSEKNLTKVKVAGIHEFCHFIAIIYAITAVSMEIQRKTLLERLSKRADELNSAALNNFLCALSTDRTAEFSELYDDRHFRLDCEGDTVDYGLLFKNLMFSKETFEKQFTEERQKEFRKLLEENNKNEHIEALNFYTSNIKKISKEKSVPYPLAFSQALQWVSSYLPK